MAGIAIPENLRPTLAAIAKYHFWILAGLVPLVLVPLLFVGAAGLKTIIAAQRRQIESKLGQARAVTAVQPHPNESWLAAIDADTQTVNRETLDEWRRFWHSQRTLRVWPSDLGQPFLDDVASLKPGDKLDRQSLVRYQNMAPRLVRSLPARMGVPDAMVEAQRDGTLTDGLRPGAGKSQPAPPLTWSPASQRRLHDSFVWQRVPNTTQVLKAQEEIWVYGLFCDLIARFVKAKGTTGAHDSPLTVVEDLAVGFPANMATDRALQEQRIWMPKAVEGSGEAMRDMAMPAEGEAAARAPWHPRFSGGPAGGEIRPPAPAAGEQPTGSPEDDYLGWIYVNFAGKPLAPENLIASADMRMVHLMPFVLRVIVDQRHLDPLLAALAASPIPIDVRQVRVNPGGGQGREGFGFRGEPGTAPPGEQAARRPNDVLVELRGSVALATPPAEAPAAAQGAEASR